MRKNLNSWTNVKTFLIHYHAILVNMGGASNYNHHDNDL